MVLWSEKNQIWPPTILTVTFLSKIMIKHFSIITTLPLSPINNIPSTIWIIWYKCNPCLWLGLHYHSKITCTALSYESMNSLYSPNRPQECPTPLIVLFLWLALLLSCINSQHYIVCSNWRKSKKGEKVDQFMSHYICGTNPSNKLLTTGWLKKIVNWLRQSFVGTILNAKNQSRNSYHFLN